MELHNLTLQDVDFERNADFFKTRFLTSSLIVFHAVNFRALALFGDTVFKEHLLFEYVTFEGYTHFRKAQFKKGLNLEYANIEKEMNFLVFQDWMRKLLGRKHRGKHTERLSINSKKSAISSTLINTMHLN